MSDTDFETRGSRSSRAGTISIWGATLLVLTLALLAGRGLLSPGFYPAHDNPLNLHRLHQMDRCVADHQLPCRWTPDMGFGYGLPLFNFYPPLPTYLGECFRLLGLSHVDAVKLCMLLSLLTAAVGMFALAREFLGVRGAIVAAALYTWSPYLAVDIFVRGALAEAWGLALLPFAFWTSYRIIEARSGAQHWALGAALTWFALLMSHHLVIAMVAPFYAAWCLLFLWHFARGPRDHRRFNLFALVLAHVAAAALAAHFLLPSLLERDTIHFDTVVSRYSWNRYANNFISVSQALFGTRPWGYAGFQAPKNGMSPFVGLLHWGLATAAAAYLLRHRLARRPTHWRSETTRAVGLLAATGWLATAMAIPASRPIWDAVPPLATLQFPWRYLGIAAFGFSFACGFSVHALEPRANLSRALAAAAVIVAVTFGWTYFRPSQMLTGFDEARVSRARIARMRHGAFDFLPRSVDLERFPTPAPEPDPSPARVVEGDSAVLSDLARGSDWIRFSVEVSPGPGARSRGALVRINTYRFPEWKVSIDGDLAALADYDDPLGRIHIRIPPGSHRVHARLEDTRLRRWSNRISILAAALLPAWVWLARRSSAGTESSSP